MKKTRMMTLSLAVLAGVLLGGPFASASSEKIAVKCRFGKTDADFSKLESLLSGPKASNIVSIEVKGASSPDGPFAVNKNLARERASRVIDVIHQSLPSLADSLISSQFSAEDWAGVERFLKRSTKAYCNEALNIVRNSPLSEREEKLQDLWAGEAWDDLMHSCFPSLRQVTVTLFYADDTAPKESLETAGVVAQTQLPDSSSCVILFKAGYRQVMPDYMSNADVIAFLRSKASEIKSVRIDCWSSPEGSPDCNERLAGYRAECVKQFLVEQFGLAADAIVVEAHGEDWDGLLREVSASYDGEHGERVVSILSDASLSGPAKKAAIRSIDGGNVWKELISSKMDALRAARISW